jgi:hypothetical protein
VIKVKLSNEPKSFDSTVRAPGLDAIREMVGEATLVKRPGRKRKKLADRREDLPSDCFPAFWQEAIPDMLEAYSHTCAYLAIHIWPAVSTATVDHMAAKSTNWDQVYEWNNYRLACALMNARKNKFDDVIDPIDVKDGTFALEFVTFQVSAGSLATDAELPLIKSTIDRLNLNSPECCKAREAYYQAYMSGDITFKFLKAKAPFIALEMIRLTLVQKNDAAEAAEFFRARNA